MKRICDMNYDELMELNYEVVSEEQALEIEEHELVSSFENCGNSAVHSGLSWFKVGLTNGQEFDIYFKVEQY